MSQKLNFPLFYIRSRLFVALVNAAGVQTDPPEADVGELKTQSFTLTFGR